MAELDPVLAAERDPFDRPRFYPHGQHPAAARLRAHIEALERHRVELVRAYGQSVADIGVSDTFRVSESEEPGRWRTMIEQTDQVLDYLRGEAALFEEGESIAKANHLRRIEGTRRFPRG